MEIMLEVKEASLKTIAAEAVDGAGSTETTSQEEAIVERVEDEAVEESAEEAIQDLRVRSLLRPGSTSASPSCWRSEAHRRGER